MTYTVKRGDTLTSIAKRHDTTVEALVASNGIKNKNRIYIGQVLQIPTKKDKLHEALEACLDAIEKLPEFKTLVSMLEE